MLTENEISEHVGRRIRQQRNLKHLSIGQLARTLEKSPITIERWEQGTNVPRLTMLLQLTAVFDCSVTDLLPTTAIVQDRDRGPA